MKLKVMIIDDFYVDPDNVRNFALSQEFSITGNFPGVRTKPYLPDDLKSAISYWMRPFGGVTEWFESSGYTGSFQITTANDRTWIHADHYNMWAGVCYLTPDAPFTSGTGLFRHRETGQCHRSDRDHESYDVTKWDMIDRVGNKYNRLVIYRGDLFHAALDYFGSDRNDGRLFQTFFFNTVHT